MITNIIQNGFDNSTIFYIVAFLIAVMFSISIHEYAHGFVAYKMGDDSALRLGRLTLNPIAHLDLFGTLAFLFFGFGWARPVPINPLHFREYRKGLFLTSIAGIVANIFMAFFSAGAYILIQKIGANATGQFAEFLVTFFGLLFYQLFVLNLGLAVFNLIPIAPLDGFNVISSLTKRGNRFVMFLAQYGFLILLLLLLTGYFGTLLGYVVNFIGVPMLDFWDFVWVI